MYKKIIIYFIAIFFCFSALNASANDKNLLLHNLKLKSHDEIKIRDKNGKIHHLKDFYGKPLILHFWATWCMPCVAEMPKLDQFQRHYGTDSIRTLAISVDYKGMKAVKPYFKKHKLRHMEPYIDIKGKLSSSFNIRGLPASIIINKEGKEIGRVIGAIDWNSPKIRELFKNIM